MELKCFRDRAGGGRARMSLLKYIASEVTRSYGLEDDEDMYTTKREKMYTFMRIPRYVYRTGSVKPVCLQGAGEVHVLRVLPLPGLLPLHIHLPPAEGELVVGGGGEQWCRQVLLATCSLLLRAPLVHLGVITSVSPSLAVLPAADPHGPQEHREAAAARRDHRPPQVLHNRWEVVVVQISNP